MLKCEVVIVGGGPAGSSCAWKLRQAGVDVLVFDKKLFPRDKTCAGWITPQVVDLLDIDRHEYQQGRILQSITGFRSGLIGGDQLETHYGRTVSYGIRRREFDHFLLQRASVPCQLGEPLESLERQANRWILNGEISAAMLIGAGGHFCPVARKLGARRDQRASIVAAQEVEFFVPADQRLLVRIEPQVPELFFCNDLKGYGWCFLKGDFLNIGLGRLDRRELTAHVGRFCEFLRSSGRVGCDIPPAMHGHAYQLYERVRPKLFDDGVLLVGDSAGLAYPQSGEGIRPAIESGLLAASTILAAQGSYHREQLATYADRVAARFGRPNGAYLTDWLPASWLHFFATRLMNTQWFTRNVVLDRWFLHNRDSVEGVTTQSNEMSATSS